MSQTPTSPAGEPTPQQPTQQPTQPPTQPTQPIRDQEGEQTDLPTAPADARATPYPQQAPFGRPPGDQPAAPPYGYRQPGSAAAPYPQHAPPAPLSVNEEKTWGMLGHISALIGGLFAVAVLGPLIVYLIHKDRSAFVRRHAAESLNFQISLLIYAAVGTVLAIVTIGIALIVLVPLAIIAFFVAVVLIILGGIAAYDGREFRYPLTIRLVH